MSPQLQKEELSAILHICCKPLGLLWYLGTTKFHLNDSEVITTDLDTKGTWLKWTLASKVSGTYLTLGPKCSLNEKEVWEPKSFSMFENFRMRSEGKKKSCIFLSKLFSSWWIRKEGHSQKYCGESEHVSMLQWFLPKKQSENVGRFCLHLYWGFKVSGNLVLVQNPRGKKNDTRWNTFE